MAIPGTITSCAMPISYMRAVETVNAMFDREWLTVCRVTRMLIERGRY